MLEITTLGGLRIKQGGKPVERLASRKATALLVYLAWTRQTLGRPLAADMLWPASSRARALRNLGVAIRQLRKHLRGDLILNAEGLALNSEAAVWLDVHALQAHLAAGRTVSAVELYRGPFLDGFHTRDIPAFGQWVAGERQRLQRQVADALQDMIAEQLAAGQLGNASEHAAKLMNIEPSLDASPWRERLQAALQRAQADESRLSLPADLVWRTEREQARSEREHLLASAQAQARRQAALFRLSAELAATLQEGEICRRVVQGLHDTLGYDVLELLLLDPATGDRVSMARVGYNDAPARLPPGQGLSELALQDGQLHYSPDVSEEPHYRCGVGGSELDVPIRVAGQVQGVLVAESQSTDGFDQDDFEVLTAAAQQAGVAIGRARLIAAERKRADELDALQRTLVDITAELELPVLLQAIVERAARLLGATGGELGLYDEAKQELRIVVSYNLGQDYVGGRHALGEGAMGRVAETGEPLVIEDYHAWEGGLPQYAHIHATMAVPLKVGTRLLGVFTSVSTEPARRFTADDLHLLSLFAHQAAIAIENAGLYSQAQREIAERTQAQAELRRYQQRLEDLVVERTADLRHSEERYRTLFDGVPAGLYRTTPEGQIVDANLCQVQMLGYPSREALLAVNSAALYAEPEERVQWQRLMEEQGLVRDFHVRFRRYDGTVIWVNDTARAVRDAQGRTLYYEGSIEDITERMHAEAKLRAYQEHLEDLVAERTTELRQSEERFRTLFEGVPIGLYRSRPDGRPIVLNQAALQMLGYSDLQEALSSIDTADLYVEPTDRGLWQALMEQEGLVRDFETRLYRRDGNVIWINDTARVVRDEQGRVLYYEGSFEDVTKRKEFEEEIRRRKEYYEALFVNNPVAVVTADLRGDIVSWNPMAEKLFGYTQEEVVGRNLDDIVANDESIRPEAEGYTQQVLELGRVRATVRRTRRDGSLVDVDLLALPVVVAGERVGFIAIYHDITDLQRARRQAEAANEAKSAFLANMSHELRTPLNAILGFSQLMDRDSSVSAQHKEYLGIINRSGEHLLALINDVLEMSKIEAGKVTVQERSFDLYRQLKGLEDGFRLRADQKGLTITFAIDENVPQHIVADEGKLAQVLSNLLGNAVKFTMQGAVALTVTAPTPAQPDPPQRRTLKFEVQDTGPGISPDEQLTIFDAFVQSETGRSAQEGTGLGLTISRQFVQMMGGELSVQSQLGQGSRFYFDVQVGLASPDATHAGPAPAARKVVALAPDQPTYRILVADDQESTRQLLVALLAPLGFEVREAANGKEAVELAESWSPHLIWMDMRMPIMDGYQATQRIKSRGQGGAPVVIALTASAFERDRERILAAGCDDFVRKPFRYDEILNALTKHLSVQYVYEERAAELAAASGPDSAPVPRVDSSPELPGALVAELRQATIRADVQAILKLIEALRTHDSLLADALADLAYEFEYQQILDLLDRGGPDGEKHAG